jgi:hypothetical protein
MYLLNNIQDRSQDCLHPTKRLCPLAAGEGSNGVSTIRFPSFNNFSPGMPSAAASPGDTLSGWSERFPCAHCFAQFSAEHGSHDRSPLR